MEQSHNKSNLQHKRRNQVDTSFVYGKVPPQAKEIETQLLGALLTDKIFFETVSSIITAESFYIEANKLIYQTIADMFHSFKHVDLLTVVEELKKREQLDLIGGPAYISMLLNTVVNPAGSESHARIIQEKFILRELIRISGQIINQALSDDSDVFDLLNYSEKSYSSLSLSTSKTSYSNLAKPVEEVIERVEMLKKRDVKDGIIGVPSGITTLDHCTAGWRKTDLIILAARPSVGKSGTAGNFALNAAQHKVYKTNVGIFSLEMSKAQWAERFVSSESMIDSWKISRGIINDAELNHIKVTAEEKVKSLGIFIDDTPGIDLFELRSKARRMVKTDKVGLIIIDYLQLMSGSKGRNENREQEISSISRGLKGLAKELNIPIIALSQLSRGVETKKGGVPQLSDLRESGAIEQDADMVIFLMNPEESAKEQDASLKDSLLLKIAKHRNGPLDTISIKFVKEIQKIMSNVEYDQWMYLKQNPGMRAVDIPLIQQLGDDEELPF